MPSSASGSSTLTWVHLAGLILGAALLGSVVQAQAPRAATEYRVAIAQEAAVRARLDELPSTAARAGVLRGVHTVVAVYEDLVKRYPAHEQSHDALWRAAELAADAFWQYGEPEDRATALRLLNSLASAYPASPRRTAMQDFVTRLTGVAGLPSSRAVATPVPVAPATTGAPRPPVSGAASGPAQRPAPVASDRAGSSTLKAIRREILPETLRVTLELEQETQYSEGRLDGPPRVFVDLRNTGAVAPLKNATLVFSDDLVRQIRVGHHEGARTRVVFDLNASSRHSIYTLYEPYRVVIDFDRPQGAAAASTVARQESTADAVRRATPPPVTLPPAAPSAVAAAVRPAPGRATPPRAAASPPAAVSVPPPADTPDVGVPATPASSVTPVAVVAPASPAAAPAAASGPTAPATSTGPAPNPPSTNGRGGFSLSRQLGLGIARIVVDPGHGGRDPGAKVTGLSEADLVLDVALRFEKLMLEQPGVEVVLTRRTDVYVPLEERTAIANKARADLFLSIHANASAAPRAVGIETYFLNFATNPDAEAIAARENAGSTRTMRELNDMVRAIATNNKVDESRDFAASVQSAMVGSLKRVNRDTRNLGVKQAPFTVLVGATMPGLLTEIGFLTHKQEGSWLKTDRYRQQIAEALATGVMAYQRSLKTSETVATR